MAPLPEERTSHRQQQGQNDPDIRVSDHLYLGIVCCTLICTPQKRKLSVIYRFLPEKL